MKKVVVLLSLLGLLIASVREADASVSEGEVYWSTPIHACTPSYLSIQNDRYIYNFDYVRPNTQVIDPAVFYCSVQPNEASSSAATYLQLTSYDEGGTASTGEVTAQLYRIDRFSGSHLLIAEVDSGNPAASVNSFVVFIGDTIDFEQYFYYVRVIVDRSSSDSGEDLRAYGVSLLDL